MAEDAPPSHDPWSAANHQKKKHKAATWKGKDRADAGSANRAGRAGPRRRVRRRELGRRRLHAAPAQVQGSARVAPGDVRQELLLQPERARGALDRSERFLLNVRSPHAYQVGQRRDGRRGAQTSVANSAFEARLSAAVLTCRAPDRHVRTAALSLASKAEFATLVWAPRLPSRRCPRSG
jgi:hypothetical protein